jgi:hypothetical protein
MPEKIKVNISEGPNEALQDEAADQRSEAINLRVTHVPSRPKPISAKEVLRIRRARNPSQAPFTTYS